MYIYLVLLPLFSFCIKGSILYTLLSTLFFSLNNIFHGCNIEHFIALLHHNLFNRSTIEEFGANFQYFIVTSAAVKSHAHTFHIFSTVIFWIEPSTWGLLDQSMKVPNSLSY